MNFDKEHYVLMKCVHMFRPDHHDSFLSNRITRRKDYTSWDEYIRACSVYDCAATSLGTMGCGDAGDRERNSGGWISLG